jgi:type IV secretory pathway component VirB8
MWQGRGRTTTVPGKKKPKTNFVEVRTFLHLYRSFDRMWIFFILALQVTLILGLAVHLFMLPLVKTWNFTMQIFFRLRQSFFTGNDYNFME